MIRVSRGFTLVELLISMTLLSMIMLLGSWSFSVFTNKWEGRLGYFSQHVSQTKDHILLNDVIMSIIPYVSKVKNNPKYYFSASASELKAVTQSSIFHPGQPVVFRLSVEESDDGSKYLLYQESLLSVFEENTDIVYTHEKILIAKASAISFSAFGWSSAQSKIRSEDPISAGTNEKPVWRTNYNSVQSNLMPISIRVAWDGNLVSFPVQNDQGMWLTLMIGESN
ncbi:hypothetical protein Ssed_3025 [Shewanella sediminis HAW-EB3]|uniref:Prepilin-type N-terminal cleavage/methylation domain-containing protein n=1 Tax=Shewanella sediminis (strain HAW-EB3) TaxID=425104 RepID=A8FXQ6_SHESH|nr:prepilin-type N-terminal cleavage/methylation domain-containing protein [Shewanella sediminis]ABV37629.1 hypothetical protein Ssed_3025 [Shewanella sediminis HAW-EB3]